MMYFFKIQYGVFYKCIINRDVYLIYTNMCSFNIYLINISKKSMIIYHLINDIY